MRRTVRSRIVLSSTVLGQDDQNQNIGASTRAVSDVGGVIELEIWDI